MDGFSDHPGGILVVYLALILACSSDSNIGAVSSLSASHGQISIGMMSRGLNGKAEGRVDRIRWRDYQCDASLDR